MSGQVLKYVRHSFTGFTVWPKRFNEVHHAHVGQMLDRNPSLARGQVLSAGFINFIGGLPVCYGGSESLGIDSLPGDTAALRAEWDLVPDVPVLSPAAFEAAKQFGAGLDPVCLEQAEAA